MSSSFGKEDGEWKVVRRARPLDQERKRRLLVRQPRHIIECPPDENDPDRHPVQKIIPRMSRSAWYIATLLKLIRALRGRKVQTFVCLGIGSMGRQKNARHQFACAVELSRKFEPKSVVVYDPAMNAEDKKLVDHFGWRIGANEIDFTADAESDDAVLVFMPHCHRVLMQRVVGELRRRGLLNNVVLLANSVERTDENLTGLAKQLEDWYIELLRSDTMVQMDCGNGRDATFEYAFNNLAVTTYGVEK